MMSDLTWDEFEERFLKDRAVVLLPVGAVEQHSYHLPLGTDWLMGTYMARRAAENIGGLVAPAVRYGYLSQVRSGGGSHRCGTISLDGSTIIETVKNVLMELALDGVKRLAVIDAHYENRFYLDEACRLAIRDLKRDGNDDVKIVKMIYCERVSDELAAKVYAGVPYPGLDLEHGGVQETAMMLYCYPDFVDMSKITKEPLPDFPPYDVFPEKPDWVPASGYLSSGKGSTVEVGGILVEELVQIVTDSLKTELGLSQANPETIPEGKHDERPKRHRSHPNSREQRMG